MPMGEFVFFLISLYLSFLIYEINSSICIIVLNKLIFVKHIIIVSINGINILILISTADVAN